MPVRSKFLPAVKSLLLVTFTTLAALALLALILPAPTAPARSEERVRNLEASYDIRPDGTVGVRVLLDWDFGEAGHHGIGFDLVTRQLWKPDPTQLVTYQVSNLHVSSPTGAPTQFTQGPKGNETIGGTSLTIGDPKAALTTSRETYEISYDLRGAVLAGDQRPEFFWNITTGDLPAVDKYRVTYSAPQPITEAQCMQGKKPCKVDLADGHAIFTGSGMLAEQALTAYAPLAPGSVQVPAPTLVPRDFGSPTMRSQDSTVTIDRDGVAHFHTALTYGVPRDGGIIRMSQPLHRPISFTSTRRFDISTPVVTGADGTRWQVDTEHYGWLPSEEESQYFAIHVPPGQSPARFTIEWQVRGAVLTEGDRAVFTWPAQILGAPEQTTQHLRWQLPGEVLSADCDGPCRSTTPPLQVSGNSVEISWDNQRVPLADELRITVPASAVVPSQPLTQTGTELFGLLVTIATLLVGLLAAVGAYFLGRRVGSIRTGTPDLRFAEVPPGVIGDGPTIESRREGRAPVRFEPPDCSLARAGFLLDAGMVPRHLAALLVSMAARGLVEIGVKPFTVTRKGEKPKKPAIDAKLWSKANKAGNRSELSTKQLRAMVKAVQSEFTNDKRNTNLFRKDFSDSTGENVRVIGVGLLAIAAVATWWLLPWFGALAVCLVAIGFAAGMVNAPRRKLALGPQGTALLDQLEGFQLYLHTAEVDQLDFEADRDIYREFLPWAVLLGEVKRWTRICQQLAASGRIPAPDLAVSGASAASLDHAVSRFTSSVTWESWSSGSQGSGGSDGGSSSGGSDFGGSVGGAGDSGSGGFSGGDGGGGFGASSW